MKSNNSLEPVLITLGSCAEYLGVSAPTVSKYIRKGMPCWLDDGRWHFHKDRVNLWFFEMCNCVYKGEKDPALVEKENLNGE